jgi:predicted dehydrogenase
MRFAIVGAGAIAQLRKMAIDALPSATFAGVFDIDAGRAGVLAGTGRVFATLDDLINANDVDTVIICTPPNTHASIAISALKADKHVVVEKPMAHSVAACKKMIAAARTAGKVLTVGFNHRYFPAIKDIRAAIESGEIGELTHLKGYSGHAGLAEFKAQWMYDKDVMGGGALLDNGIHMIDLMQHLMGPVHSVFGKVLDKTWQIDRVEDNGYAILTGDTGIIGTLGASWTEWKGYHFYIEAYGTKGMARAYYAPMMSTIITMDRPGGARKTRRNFYVPLIFKEKFRGWQSTASQTLAEELTDFMALVQGRTDGRLASAADGLRAIEIAQAVYTSSQSNSATTLA